MPSSRSLDEVAGGRSCYKTAQVAQMGLSQLRKRYLVATYWCVMILFQPCPRPQTPMPVFVLVQGRPTSNEAPGQGGRCRAGEVGGAAWTYLDAAANATARAAVASSNFFLFFSSINCFSTKLRASCSAFSFFSNWLIFCLSFCFICTALCNLYGNNCHTEFCH